MMFLSGVRVLEFSIAWAGPLAGRFLADLGAEVIKVEHPTSRGIGVTGAGGFRVHEDTSGWTWGQLPGPVFRSGIYPDADPGEQPWNRQGMFNKMNRNKKSLCIDLKMPGGREVFERLVAKSDIVINNYSPRGVRSLGIDYQSLAAINPRIVALSLSGYGATGPDQDRVSWGPMLESQSGLAATTGYPSGGPLKMGAALPDPMGGTTGAFAALAALSERDRTGHGVSVDISQLETYASIGGELYLAASLTGEPPPRVGNRSARFAPQGVYRCDGDDAWIAITIASDEEWAALSALVATPALQDPTLRELPERSRRHDELDVEIEAWTSGQDKYELTVMLQEAGVTAFASLTNADIVADPHLADRGFMVEWDQPQVGRRSFPGFPLHFSRTPKPEMRPTPPLGADNRYVLSDVLGMDAADIGRLEDAAVVTDKPPE
jgi:crotonobetainyl-CoA:carnitine CoA-transferase CaiB-like acyl-CoA transferase